MTQGCHGSEPGVATLGGQAGRGGQDGRAAPLRVALVGAPNVGKSALFNRLTGRYVTVSNYPGTSIEIARGTGRIAGVAADIVDTPGMYSLLPTTEEERVAREVVLTGDADVLVHVVDAKNVERMLPLTLQLLEARRPLVLALNMADEAERAGVRVDVERLRERLGIPVLPIVAITGRGLSALERAILDAPHRTIPLPPPYANGVGHALASLRERLSGVYPVDPLVFASLLLQGDVAAADAIRSAEPNGGHEAVTHADGLAAGLGGPAAYRIAVERQRTVTGLLDGAIDVPARRATGWRDRIGRALQRPLTGIPILLVVVYLGLYQFVGHFGAGVLVDWIEGTVFAHGITPFLDHLFQGIPWPAWRSLYVGEYGLLTLGLRYAVAIILPIVGTFFLFFSVLEDSGYFPRLALLVDRLFKRIGLSGRAVIPIVLGFACDTMATMVTRTLETKRERVLATLLLALAIPCSAQLGVIMAIVSGRPFVLVVWIVAVVATFMLVGALGAKLLPGERAAFHMEIPPLRMPRLGNVLTKTYTRMHWYFLEVLPLFLFASVLLWIGQLTGAFDWTIHAMKPVVSALGLPAETARIFLFGFFRRDYGAAGLFDLDRQGLLSSAQLAVAAVTLTLFVPCIAQFLMMLKERGAKTAIGMVAFITPFAFGVGYLLHLLLGAFAW